MNRRSFLATLSLLSGAAVTGCGSSGASGKPGDPGGATRVKLALNWVPEPEFGGFYAAREAGDYKAEGIDVEIIKGGSGAPVVQMLGAGQVDFAVTGADEVLAIANKGVQLVPLFACYQTSPAGIMAHSARATLSDVFASGTVALTPGLAASLFLKKKYGFDKVTIVPYDGGVARFLTDEAYSQQCFVTSEPVLVRRKGHSPRVFLLADEGFNAYSTLLVTSRQALAKAPDLVARFVRATRRGWERYLADPGPANAVMAALNPAMDRETFAEVAAAQKPLVENADTRANGLGTMRRERWETLSKQLVELGILERAPDLDGILVPVPEPEAPAGSRAP